jgi:hypothetical protein
MAVVVTLETMYEMQNGRSISSVRDDEVVKTHVAVFACPRCGQAHGCVADLHHAMALNEVRAVAQGKAPSREA